MAKKYLNFAGLEVYDEQIKAYIDGEINSIPSDVFAVTFINENEVYSADKTFAEVEEAIADKKMIVGIYNNVRYTISSYFPDALIIFSFAQNLGTPTVASIIWNNSTGSIVYDTTNVQSVSNRTTVLSSSSTHTQYPSAKAAVDYVNTQISSHNHDDLYYTQAQIDGMKFITTDDIDEICGGVTEEGLPSNDIDELMAQLEEV